MIILRTDPEKPDPECVRQAADALRRGELVVFPTETVYGLAADTFNEAAVRLVFEAKGRGQTHALPVQIAAVEQLAAVVREIPPSARALAAKFWPGPLTIVLPKSDAVPDVVTGGGDTVGVRVPDHAVALALLKAAGVPIVATSANVSGSDAPTNAEAAIRALGDAVSVVLDAGECRIGTPSTVVDLSITPPRIVREGAIGRGEIEAVLGERLG